MTHLRIYVSCYGAKTEQPTGEIGKKLAQDLRAAGAQVIIDSESIRDEFFVQFLRRELAQCQWLILVQTPGALQSLRVQTVVSTAFTLVEQKQMQGVLRVLTAETTAEEQELPATWMPMHTFDASQDYPRALHGLLLALGLAGSDKLPHEQASTESKLSPPLPSIDTPLLGTSKEKQDAPPSFDTTKSSPPSSEERRQPPSSSQVHLRSWLVPLRATVGIPRYVLLVSLVILLILLSIVGVFSFNAVREANNNIAVAAQATNTARLLQRPHLALDDPLSDNSKGNTWDENVGCTFTSGTYHVISSDGYSNICLAENTHFKNFSYQVQMMLVKGEQGGMIFRFNSANITAYYFYLNYNKGKWMYRLSSFGFFNHIISSGPVPSLNTDPKQSIVLKVVAQNSTITLFVNGMSDPITTLTDSDAGEGKIGVAVGSFTESTGNTTEVAFSNVQVRTL